MSDTDIDQLPFEKALAELESIVSRIEKGEISLDDSIKLYERGQKLKQRCEMVLRQAEMRIESLNIAADGTPTGVKPLDV
jgi:exodeoxyribonuclease VII small subunit